MFDREVAQELLRQLPGDLDEPNLLLVGIGGAGINMLQAITGGAGFRKAAIDTDDFLLALSRVPRQLHLRIPREGGTRGDVDVGRAAALRHRDEILEMLDGDIILLMAGLGRGTGTGVAPEVARLAQGRGLPVLSFLVWPFREEGVDASAREGLAAVRAACDGLLVLDNAAALSLPDIEAKGDAAQLVNEMMARVLLDLHERVHGAFPFSVREEMADFLEELPSTNDDLPVRATAWARGSESGPLAVDRRGVVALR